MGAISADAGADARVRSPGFGGIRGEVSPACCWVSRTSS